MIGEPDAGKPPVRFDEGVQESATPRLRPTLQRPAHLTARVFCARYPEVILPLAHAASANTKFGKSSNTHPFFSVR